MNHDLYCLSIYGNNLPFCQKRPLKFSINFINSICISYDKIDCLNLRNIIKLQFLQKNK